MFRNLFKHLKSSQYSELEQRVRDATSLDGKTATAAEVERIIEQTKETADNCQLVCSVLLSRVSAPEPPHVTKGLSLLLSLLDSLPPHARAFFVETVIEHNDLFTRLSQINDRVPNAIVIRSGASEAMKLAAEHSLSSNNPAAAQATAAELAANQSSSDASFVASVAPAAAAGPPPAAPSGPPPPVSARARQASLASKMHATLSEDINGVSSDAVVYTADGRIAAAPAPSSQPTAYQPIDLRGMSPSVASGSPTAAEAAAAAAAATSTGGGIAAGVPAVAVYDHPDYALVVASGPAYGSTRGNRGGRGVKPQVPPPTVGPSLASRMRAGTGGGTGGSGTGLDDLGAYDPCPSPAMEPTSAAAAGGVPSVALTASSPVVAAGKKGGMDVDYDEGEAEGESALAIEEGALVGAALGIQGDDEDDDDEEVAFSAGF